MTHETTTMSRPAVENTPVAGRGFGGTPDGSKGSLVRGAAQLLTLMTLAGVAYVGHSTHWRFGWHQPARGPDHLDPALIVTVENESLAIQPDAAEWCTEHDVAHCPLCNPHLAQVDPAPHVSPAELQRVRIALASCQPSTNQRACLVVHHRLRLSSAEAAERLGIEVAPAWTAEMSDVISTSGKTSFDPTRVAHLSARAPATAWRVLKRLGQTVQKGEVLALLESADVGRAKAELQQSLVQLRLKHQAYENTRSAPVAEQKRRETHAALRDAEARVLSAEQGLVNLGLSVRASELSELPFDAMANALQRLGLPEPLADLGDELIPATLLPIVSPLDGTVTQCDVVAGESVDASRTLLTIADGTRLVLTLHLSAVDVSRIAVGQSVRFRADGAHHDTTSSVSWIGSTAQDRTRTVPIRAELDNRDGHLLAGMFGRGAVVLRHAPDAVVVPNEAIQTDGDCQLVFVRDKEFLRPDGPKVFHIRSVRTGAKDDRQTEVVVGVLPGEVVATRGSDRLLNEVLRNRFSSASRPGP